MFAYGWGSRSGLPGSRLLDADAPGIRATMRQKGRKLRS